MRVLHIKIGLVAKLFAVSCVAVFSLSSSAVTREKKAPPPTDPEIFRVVPQTCTPAKGQFVWNFEDEELIYPVIRLSEENFLIDIAIKNKQELCHHVEQLYLDWQHRYLD